MYSVLMRCVGARRLLAKDEDKKEASAAASSSVSSSVLNLAGIGSLGKDRRQHNGVSVFLLMSVAQLK